ncbi:MAG: phage portal protein, partial [Candidatus Aureabacteria bacterium]|nr:phage portal protein [Candidatus Auribacterota bacterium]
IDAGQIMNTAVPEAFKKQWGGIEHINRPVPYPATGAGKDSAHLVEVFARDGASFLKDTDQHGLVHGFWQYAYKFPHGKPIPFSPREIIYAMLHPLSYTCYGKCPLQTIQDVLDTLVNSVLHNKQFFSRNMVPPGLISVMGMSKDNFGAFKSYFNKEVRGKPHTIPLLNPGIGGKVEWVSFIPSPRDLQFLDTQKWYVRLVLAAFGVTPSEVGLTEDTNRATAEEQSYVYKRRSIKPMIRRLEYYINLGIVAELGIEGVKFAFTPAIDSHERTRLTSIYVQEITTGLRTINEIREDELDKEKVEWGDDPPWEHQQPNPFGGFPDQDAAEDPEHPRDEDEPAEEEEEEQEEEAKRPQKSLDQQFTEFKADILKTIKETVLIPHGAVTTTTNANEPYSHTLTPVADARPTHTEQLELGGDSTVRYKGCGGLFLTADEEIEKLYKALPEEIDDFYGLPNPGIETDDIRAVSPHPLEVEYRQQMQSLFVEQKREVLKELGKGALTLEAARKAAIAISTRQFMDFLKLARNYMLKAMQRGANKAVSELKLGISFSLEDPEAITFLKDYANLLSQSKYKQIREHIRGLLIRGLQEGKGAFSVAKDLEKHYGIQYKRAENIARTEVMRAMNWSRRHMYEKSGLVKAKQWLVTWDDRLCPICRPMANKTAGLQDYFVTEEGLRVLEPPVHPQCRCTIIPVLYDHVIKTDDSFFIKTDAMKKIEARFKPYIDEYQIELLLPALYKTLSMEQVGKALGITKMTVSRWMKELKIETRPTIAEDPKSSAKKKDLEKDSMGKKGNYIELYNIEDGKLFIRDGEKLETALKRNKSIIPEEP